MDYHALLVPRRSSNSGTDEFRLSPRKGTSGSFESKMDVSMCSAESHRHPHTPIKQLTPRNMHSPLETSPRFTSKGYGKSNSS
jgi:hypothetical protein